jgi:hypothetical protein
MTNLKDLNIQSCASALTVAMRRAVAAAIAEKTLPFFAGRWPEEATTLSAAISYCWSVADHEPPDETCADEWMQCISRKVPNADIDPYAGPAIPAGEAVLAALGTIGEPTPARVEEVVVLGFTAYEMDVYIRSPDSAVEGGQKLGAEVQSLLKKVGLTDVMQGYLGFVGQLLAEAHIRTPLELRSWAQNIPIPKASSDPDRGQ